MIAALALAALGACTAQPPASTLHAFRPATAPIWSSAAFAPARIEGRWAQVAAYHAGAPACRAGAAEITKGPSGLQIRARLCLDGRDTTVSGPLVASGPGRLSVPGMEDWWVIWVDSGYRTLAIATPSGRFGFLLDRGGLPRDRLEAAREIFEFNGYSRAGLRPF